MLTVKTPVGAYASTPHKTMRELERIAIDRVRAGEPLYYVLQDIIDGYHLGWGSKNAQILENCVRLATAEGR